MNPSTISRYPSLSIKSKTPLLAKIIPRSPLRIRKKTPVLYSLPSSQKSNIYPNKAFDFRKKFPIIAFYRRLTISFEAILCSPCLRRVLPPFASHLAWVWLRNFRLALWLRRSAIIVPVLGIRVEVRISINYHSHSLLNWLAQTQCPGLPPTKKSYYT